MTETCVCCGDIIPEGRQVCPRCETTARCDAPYVVFGTQDTSDKAALGYRDGITGMWAVKFLQLSDRANYDAEVDFDNIEGEYFTLYFAHKNGFKSLCNLIDVLEQIRGEWEVDNGSID